MLFLCYSKHLRCTSEADSAYANERLMHGTWNLLEAKLNRKANAMQIDLPILLDDWYRCHSHQNCVLQSTNMFAHDTNVLGRSFCLTQFLASGKCWLRLGIG